MRAIPAAVAIFGLAAVTPASAAEVRFEERGCNRWTGCEEVVVFDAAPGEANDVRVAHEAGRVVVSDLAAPLTAGRKCALASPGQVVCPRGLPEIHGGDGDDRVQVGAASREDPGAGLVFAYGGPGRDELHGGTGGDWLTGGSGADWVGGGVGDDVLFDGVRGIGEPDVFDGGEGTDEVRWAGRRRPVVASLLAPGAAGSAGEGDRLVAVESLFGGERDDVLTGNEGANALWGGHGADLLLGRGGDDFLGGGFGDDVLRGESGADRLDPTDGSPNATDIRNSGDDRFRCGPGPDTVDHARSVHLVDATCERVQPANVSASLDLLLPLATATAPVARVRGLFCSYDRCRAELLVHRGERVLGRRRIVWRGGTKAAAVRLSPAGRGLLRRRGRLRVTIRVRESAASGGLSVVLRAPS